MRLVCNYYSLVTEYDLPVLCLLGFGCEDTPAVVGTAFNS